MVGKVIRDYMGGGARKLTVPGFGTFMSREAGRVIFVDLLRSDDGVLRELVEDYGQYSEVEAMALIDRFIFGIKNDIAKHGRASIDGFGAMMLDHNGLFQFDHSPGKKLPARETAVQEKLFGSDEGAERKSQQSVKTSRTTTEHISENRSRPKSAEPVKRANPARGMREVVSRGKSRASRSDVFMIVAIAAAVIAVIAMVFGLSTGNMPFLP